MSLLPPQETTLYLLSFATGLFVLASIFYFTRVVKGPSLPDIVLAVDTLSYDLAVFMVLFSLLCNSPLLAVGALPLVLWAYLLDMYVSKYLVKRELGD
ncbi:monovalent cation/H+ antiporter complex subunit F [Staphylothermus hellenicus]|uniref:Multiple resistance and pH regulation protein F n=1 Tax=Staphylothermus hellenicus (strain DSM 12710 / JCM 10830 / BK20S6-10-b1 / P8) TaxID=591019 RepID=D7DAT7_STAHD|nr:monovalent cation/H+ antiporter complex subunit F [Staphylothermus hellenicus]ADI31284.1 multiple resistance and pH regulation protein F [Staphylothermus hellenicus DSM 12710]